MQAYVTLQFQNWVFVCASSFIKHMEALIRGGCQVTLVSFVWFFSTVRFQMSPQSACFRGCIVTLFAFVRLFSTVRFQMSPQIACQRGCKIALAAFVWFNDIVSHFIQGFYICILWNKVIIFHLLECHCVLCFDQMIASNWVKFIIDFWSLSFPCHTFTF